ncbi:hypothetical protein CB1_002523010 [Camelus ferus]|nr:hypothetical protein CB1_002523010 [Camelus ferus]
MVVIDPKNFSWRQSCGTIPGPPVDIGPCGAAACFQRVVTEVHRDSVQLILGPARRESDHCRAELECRETQVQQRNREQCRTNHPPTEGGGYQQQGRCGTCPALSGGRGNSQSLSSQLGLDKAAEVVNRLLQSAEGHQSYQGTSGYFRDNTADRGECSHSIRTYDLHSGRFGLSAVEQFFTSLIAGNGVAAWATFTLKKP